MEISLIFNGRWARNTNQETARSLLQFDDVLSGCYGITLGYQH